MVRLFIIGVASAAIGAAPAATPKQSNVERSAENLDKVICKQFAKTGSLVESYRTCKTKREWDRERDNVRALSVSDGCQARAEGGYC